MEFLGYSGVQEFLDVIDRFNLSCRGGPNDEGDVQPRWQGNPVSQAIAPHEYKDFPRGRIAYEIKVADLSWMLINGCNKHSR